MNHKELALKSHFTIFITGSKVDIPSAHEILPMEGETYDVEDIKNLLPLFQTPRPAPTILLFPKAESFTNAALVTFLKHLEEPPQNLHLVFLAASRHKLPATIISRAHLHYLDPPATPLPTGRQLDQAKRLLTAKGMDLIDLANTLAKDRTKTSLLLEETISLAVASFYKTKNPAFLARLQSLLPTAINISSRNAHIKTSLLAALL